VNKIIVSVLGGIAFGILTYFLIETWCLGGILFSNIDIWEIIRLRGIETIGIIIGIAIGFTGIWNIYSTWQEISKLRAKGIKIRGKSR
jgi:hypothetical protein